MARTRTERAWGPGALGVLGILGFLLTWELLLVVYAFIVTTGLLGVLINLGMRVLERRSLAWHSSVRGEAAA